MNGSNETPKHRDLTSFEKDLLLAFFKHVMTQEQRGELMATMPAAYNAFMGREIVEVRKAGEKLCTKEDSK